MVEVQAKTSWGLLALGVALGLGMIASSGILARTFKEIKSENQIIEVSGFAQKQITSDWAIWNCSFNARAATLPEANTQLEAIRKQIEAYLARMGARPAELSAQPPSAGIVYVKDQHGQQTEQIEGYTMAQGISYSSADIDRVTSASQGIAALYAQGLPIDADAPTFLYTRLDDMKMEMLGEAAANARQRAEKLAGQNQSGVGALRYIHQGVFQITPPFSNEVTDYGVNDTSSRLKNIKAIVTVRYAVKN